MIRSLAILAFAVATAAAVLVSGERGGRLLLGWDLPALAAPVLRDPAWHGVALYRAGLYAQAQAELRRTRSPEAAYNLGNALARDGRLAAAVAAYDLALLRDPNDADARANRALVLALLSPHAPADNAKLAVTASATATKESSTENMAGDAAALQSSQGDGMAGQREAGSSADKVGSSRVDRRGDPSAGTSDPGNASSKGAASDSAGRAGRGGGQTTVAHSDRAPPREVPPPVTADTAQATLQWLASLPDDPVRFLRARIAAEHQQRMSAGTAAPRGGSAW